ncbi:MAG: hypothetical protein HC769_05355 [Cyanobacteria bacterium CRU_2_1]|nr:hypothetical protein [Cyanobacteria bacterium RU_5_0]NJR58325.1 hypothetical protein [Cyanobacteria bacterium CRU_2_1]
MTQLLIPAKGAITWIYESRASWNRRLIVVQPHSNIETTQRPTQVRCIEIEHESMITLQGAASDAEVLLFDMAA